MNHDPKETETPSDSPAAAVDPVQAPTPSTDETQIDDVFSDQPVFVAPAPTELTALKGVLEAILMAAGRPLTVDQLHDLFGENQSPGKDRILEALSQLMADCEHRGIELVEVASGFRFQVKTATQIWVSRLWTERQTKYSRALLETLALIAYRQPITRAEIEAIRGVAVSSHIIKTLEEREWIRVLGHRDVPGRPALFGTTRQFLDYFNLKSLEQLPPLAELRDFDALEPQMPLAGTTLDETGAAGDGTAADSSADPPATENDTPADIDDAAQTTASASFIDAEPTLDSTETDVEHLHEDGAEQGDRDIERDADAAQHQTTEPHA